MEAKTTVRGCCPLDCQDTCSWVATVEAGVVTRVNGAKDHPFTRGGLCAKVRDYQTRTYSKDRLLTPLLRCGPKGDGTFQAITWDHAFGIIAERFNAIITESGAEALLPYHYLGSMGMLQQYSLMRLFNALGSSRLDGDICGAPGFALGAEGHPIGFDWEQVIASELIVVWGANMLSTCHHHWHFVKQAQRAGAKVIAIDPRVTRTTRQCDQHITVRPGTDEVLAGGMLNIMFTESLMDTACGNSLSRDFGRFLEQLSRCTPQHVQEVCGVEPQVLHELAREIASARPATLRLGVGPQQSIHGDALVRTLSAMALLGGHHELTGGGLFIAEFPQLHEERAAASHLGATERRSLDMTRLGLSLNDAALSPPIKGLMCWNTNPAVVLPDSRSVRKGLSRDDLFTVVVEHFLTDTARYADIVLPSTTQLEHFDLLGSWGHSYLAVNYPAIPPLGETKSHGDITRGLAKSLQIDLAELSETDEQMALSALPSNIDTEALLTQGWLKCATANTTRPTDLRFSTDIAPREDSKAFQLLTPKVHHFLNSSFANMPRQARAEGEPLLEINPEDAAELGLIDGSPVLVRNSQGQIRARIKHVAGMHRKVVALPGKRWSDNTQAVSNDLTPSVWSVMGQPAYNDTEVWIVAEGE